MYVTKFGAFARCNWSCPTNHLKGCVPPIVQLLVVCAGTAVIMSYIYRASTSKITLLYLCPYVFGGGENIPVHFLAGANNSRPLGHFMPAKQLQQNSYNIYSLILVYAYINCITNINSEEHSITS